MTHQRDTQAADKPLDMDMTPTQRAVDQTLADALAIFADPARWCRGAHCRTADGTPCGARDPDNPAASFDICGALWLVAPKIAHAVLAEACVRRVLNLRPQDELREWNDRDDVSIEGVRRALTYARRQVRPVVQGISVGFTHALYAERAL